MEQEELFVPSFSGVFSISYRLEMYDASIDWAGKVYGPMNLPTYDEPFKREESSPWFTLQNLQFNKRFNSQLSSYIAVKNIIDYTQESPIIDLKIHLEMTLIRLMLMVLCKEEDLF